MARLRLLKLVVQPTFVLDHGDHLEELTAGPFQVAGKDWPGWATEGYTEAFEALNRQLGDGGSE